MRAIIVFCLGILPISSSVFAQQATTAPPGVIATTQQRVDPTMTYHRVLAIVPLVGSGTAADPKRPMFAPTPQASTVNSPQAASANTPPSTGIPKAIIAYQHQLSDDGTLSLVEFVATDRSAFAALFASTDARVQYFEVGKSTQAEIQAAFQQKKAAFSFNTFHPLPVQ
jgi:hypothetical protein